MPTSLARLCFLFMSFSATLAAQTQVQKLIGASGFDDGWVVSVTPEGGYLIAGQTTSAGDADKDVFVTKLSPSFEIEWTRVLGGPGEDWITKGVGLQDSTFVFAGFTAVEGRQWDGWLFKMDLAGGLLWSKRYGGTGNDMLVDVFPRPDGSLIVTGHGTTYSGGAGWDFWVLSVSGAGDDLGLRSIGGYQTEAMNSMTPTADGGFIIAGHTYSYGVGMHDVVLLKLAPSLEIQWMKTYGTGADETAYVIHQRQDGGYIVVCGTHAGAYGVRDAMVMSVDSGGNFLRAWSIGTSGEDQLVRGVDLGHLGLVVSGWASDAEGVLDGWYIQVSDTGDLVSSERCGGPGADRLVGASRTQVGDLIFAGNSASGGAAGTDAYFVRTPLGGLPLNGGAPGPMQTTPMSLSVGSISPPISYHLCEVQPGPDSVLSPSFSISDLFAPQASTRKVSVPNLFGRAGDPALIPVMLEMPIGVAGADLALTFDTSIVAVEGVMRGTLTGDFSMAFNLSRPDSILVSLAHATGIVHNQTGSLIIVRASVKPEVPDSTTTPIVIAKARLYNADSQPLEASVTNGVLSMGFGRKGDVNGDGEQNSADAIIVLRLSAGLEQRNERDRWAADFDGNGVITPFDAVGVLRASVGLATPPPGDTLDVPVRVYMSPVSAAAGQVVEMPVRIEGLPDMVSGTLEFGVRSDLVEAQASKVHGSFGGLSALAVVDPSRVRLVFAAQAPWGQNSAAVASVELKALAGISDFVPSFLGGTLTDKDGRSVRTIQFVTTDVSDPSVVSAFALHPNHPNPFNPSTTIMFDVPRRSHVQVFIRNLLGQTVAVLVNEVRTPGTYQADWHAQVGSGVYFCTMLATDDATGETIATFTRKLALVK